MTSVLVLGLISAVILAVALAVVLVTILLFLGRVRRVLVEIQAPLGVAADDGRGLAERLGNLRQACSVAATELLAAHERLGIAQPSDRMHGPSARGRER